MGFGIIRVNAQGKPEFVDMGVIDLRKCADAYDKLEVIYEKVGALCDLHHPDDMALESPFYGKNAQVILKLGRAQGSAMIAALSRGIPVFEYAPRKAKMALCGNGNGSIVRCRQSESFRDGIFHLRPCSSQCAGCFAWHNTAERP